MGLSSFVDVCRFNPTAGGTTDWTFSSAVLGYQSPSAAGVVNGAQYSYRAESADLSQWEVGFGTYNTSTGVLSRGTVLFNSSGGTSKISFTIAPQVAIVALAEDLPTLPVSVANGGTGYTGGAWSTFTPTITAGSGTFTTVSAAGSFLQIGKLVSFICTITITTVGTASGNIFMPLPVGTLKRAFATCGVETAITGKTVNVFGAASASALSLNQGNNLGASLIAAGNVLTFSGTYEAA